MARFLIAEDDPESRVLLKDVLESAGNEVLALSDGSEVVGRIAEFHPDVVILDNDMPKMSGLEVVAALKAHETFRFIPTILLTAKSTIEDIVTGFNAGADDYIVKPFKKLELLARAAAAFRLRDTYSGYKREKAALSELQSIVSNRISCGELLGSSDCMRKVYDIIDKYNRSRLPVLITGESGSGKELVARAIHYGSERKNRPFVAFNCATFVEGTTESELFGHVKGAFTGAVRDNVGLFETANGGTLFLDEIGDLNLNLQAKLLRTLQEGEITPVGSVKSKKVDVRVVAATHKDLEQMVSRGMFRDDLYYRLAVLPVTLPPLRERLSDIDLLVEATLKEISQRDSSPKRRCSTDLLDKLKAYSWPGNVRELRNEIERLVLLCGEGIELDAHYLSPKIARVCTASFETSNNQALDLHHAISEVEKRFLLQALQQTNGNKSEAARLLGISRSNLIEKVKTYGLSVE